MHDATRAGTIPEHFDQVPELQRFTCWGNTGISRRFAPTHFQLGTIDAVSVYETQVKRRPLPELNFF